MAKQKAAAASAAQTNGYTHISVSSFAKRFCEAGRAFYPEPTLIALDELEDDEIELLENSPYLKVSFEEVAPPADDHTAEASSEVEEQANVENSTK